MSLLLNYTAEVKPGTSHKAEKLKAKLKVNELMQAQGLTREVRDRKDGHH